VRKPGAFENYRYREELFPTSRFRMVFDGLQETLGRGASKEYLGILELAAKESEGKVDETLGRLLAQGEGVVNADQVEASMVGQNGGRINEVEVATVDLRMFDELCGSEN
jgi:hypothetical protein